MKLLALRRLAMTCQVCPGQIFSLYYLTKCTYCMSSCSLKHTESRTLAALLSVVSSFHQLTPPLAVSSGPHTQKKNRLLTTPPTRSFLQVLYQIRVIAKTGKWQWSPMIWSNKSKSNMIDISAPTEGTAVEGWAMRHHKTCNCRNASTHWGFLLPSPTQELATTSLGRVFRRATTQKLLL